MYITIAGGGLIGRGLAKRLVEAKHDVVIIDTSQEVCEAIYSEYGAVTIQGDATDLKILESAGIERSDMAVAAMRFDSANLTFALLARHLGIPNIHVRMMNPTYEPIYKSVGVTNIGRVSELLIEQFMVNIETPELRKVVNLGDLEIGIVNVPAGSACVGRDVATFTSQKKYPRDVIITCIYTESTESFIIPHGDTVIHDGDRLFLCGKRSDIRIVAKSL